MSTVSEEQRQAYLRMRQLDFDQLTVCYNVQKQAFLRLGKENGK